MKLYADLPGARARQIALDVSVLVWSFVWVRLGIGLYRVVERLRVAGDTTESAGLDLAARLDGVADVIDGVPLVGRQLRVPFSEAAAASQGIATAGATTSDAVHTLALWLGVLLAVLPIVWLLSKWLPPRARWVREASAATRLRLDDPSVIDLLAWRAATAHPLAVVAPHAGDTAALARLELRRLGLRG
ncbi:MAG TPA: hypothetical protein VM345_13305 [Acidimicrobiales bacterium]|jgi:hypothetical protein|nr:hypothetical protein [Acidimicrobiales bacterium]